MTNHNHDASGPGLSLPDDDLETSAEQLRGGYVPALGAMVDGKYRIDRLIARGGMGAVFAATHCVSGKKVALKWMLPALSQIMGARERFVREARATARISHPNIVDIYDVGTEHDSVYLVMKYLHGETLAERLARVRLPPQEAVALLMPALRGIAEAHRHGVIHRDLKPDNIFLCCTDSGIELEATVLDFGISKIAGDELRELELTQSGTVLGTPYYMAPEQVRGARDVDVHADVYSIGVILFEVLAGQKPFDADTYNELILKIATEPPPELSSLVPDVAPGLAAIVERAMARDAEARFHSIEELALALEAFSGGVRFQGPRSPGFQTTVSATPPELSNALETALPSSRALALPEQRPSGAGPLSVRKPPLPAPLAHGPALAGDAHGRVNVASIAIALTLCVGGAVYLARYTSQHAAPRAHVTKTTTVVSGVETAHAAPSVSAATPDTAPTAPAPATDTALSRDDLSKSETPAPAEPIATATHSARGNKSARSARSPAAQVSKRTTPRRERREERERRGPTLEATTQAGSAVHTDWDSRITIVPSQAAGKPEAPAGSIGTDDF